MAFNYEYPYTDMARSNSDWLLNTVKKVVADIEGLEEWKKQNQDQYNEIIKWYNDINNGIFPVSVQNAFIKWLEKNAINIIGELATTVFFGLTDSGYFVAYVPESWKDIIFRTSGLDTLYDEEYGHLVLITPMNQA